MTVYMGRVVELPVTMLSIAKIGAIHSVVYGGFSEQALADRINDAQSKVVVTCDGAWLRNKTVNLKEIVDEALEKAPIVESVVVYKRTGQAVQWKEGRDLWWHDLRAKASSDCPTEQMDAEDPMFILYTSGSTGKPKGQLHTCGGYQVHIATTLKYEALAEEYAAWFAAAQIRPEFRESTDWHLTMMRQSRSRYERLGKRLGIPWSFIAATHGLEASFNFRAHFHNGDFPLSRRTRQVPANRPPTWLPPSDWESSAADALRLLGFTGQSDWSLPRTLYRLEAYNGFGYRRAGRASPYLWSFSSLYSRGKFVADGKFDPKARSKQCGAAVMLKLLDLAGELG